MLVEIFKQSAATAVPNNATGIHIRGAGGGGGGGGGSCGENSGLRRPGLGGGGGGATMPGFLSALGASFTDFADTDDAVEVTIGAGGAGGAGATVFGVNASGGIAGGDTTVVIDNVGGEYRFGWYYGASGGAGGPSAKAIPGPAPTWLGAPGGRAYNNYGILSTTTGIPYTQMVPGGGGHGGQPGAGGSPGCGANAQPKASSTIVKAPGGAAGAPQTVNGLLYKGGGGGGGGGMGAGGLKIDETVIESPGAAGGAGSGTTTGGAGASATVKNLGPQANNGNGGGGGGGGGAGAETGGQSVGGDGAIGGSGYCVIFWVISNG